MLVVAHFDLPDIESQNSISIDTVRANLARQFPSVLVDTVEGRREQIVPPRATPRTDTDDGSGWDAFATEINQTLELVLFDSKNQASAQLEVVFRSRLNSANFAMLSGHDESHSVSVSIEWNLAASSVRTQIRPSINPEASPRALLPVVTFLEALQTGSRFVLQVPSSGKILGSTEPIQIDAPGIQPGLAHTIRSLERLQRHTKNEFPIPREITATDRKQIALGVALLDGKTVRGEWSKATIEASPDVQDSFRKGGPDLQIEIDAPIEINVGQHVLPLGNVTYLLAHARITPIAEEGGKETEVCLEAGVNRLVEVSLSHLNVRKTDSKLHQPPIDVLQQYAGEWIAQDGERVIASGPTPAAVAATLQTLGESGSIWLVPGTQADAEFTPVGL
ncbi:DUF5678 domain-containing protein [Rhodococcus qingshengii]|uniref:DUF5678 domain-containing protein n=1 Tax=Rhodococcus qingshengii TaxID=334542 RepID=UPI0039C34BF4